MANNRPRFPVGLTIASAIAFAILIGLGVWQVKRLAWKTDMLARIEALQHAKPELMSDWPAQPSDLEFHRVTILCPWLKLAPFEEIYAVVDGQVAYRLVSACRLGGGRYDTILVDRGYVPDSVSTRPPVDKDWQSLGAAGLWPVQGVLRKGDKKPAKYGPPIAAGEGTAAQTATKVWYGRDVNAIAKALNAPNPAPYFLMAETSTNPDLPQLKPAPVPTDIPNNHLSYAITWFGLAAALVGVYAALLRKKMQG